MPGRFISSNRISWRDANGASNTVPTESEEPPNGFGTKKVPYRSKLTEDDRTKQSIKKYWNYRIALFTKMTSSSLKCLPEEDIPSNKPEIDYVESGPAEFVRDQFEMDTYYNPQSSNNSDTASNESTEISSTSSSFVGKTDPETVVVEDFSSTSQIVADSNPFITAGTESSDEASLQISQPGLEEIEAAIIQIKAFLENGRNELAPVNNDVVIFPENNSQNELDTGRFTAPLPTNAASLLRDKFGITASCSSMNTSTSEVAEMRGKDVEATSSYRLEMSTSTADL